MGDDWEIAKGQLQLERDKLDLEKRRLEWIMAHEAARLELDRYEADTRRMSLEANRG